MAKLDVVNNSPAPGYADYCPILTIRVEQNPGVAARLHRLSKPAAQDETRTVLRDFRIEIIGRDADDLEVRPQFLQGRCKRLTVRAWLVGHYNAGVSHDGVPASHVRGWESTSYPLKRARRVHDRGQALLAVAVRDAVRDGG
jgi:hypothetical protein